MSDKLSEPRLVHHDWYSANSSTCDFCNNFAKVVKVEGGMSCSSCCDDTHLQEWKDYARKLASRPMLSFQHQIKTSEERCIEEFGSFDNTSMGEFLGALMNYQQREIQELRQLLSQQIVGELADVRKLVANLATIVRVQNGNLHADVNVLLEQADNFLSAVNSQ